MKPSPGTATLLGKLRKGEWVLGRERKREDGEDEGGRQKKIEGENAVSGTETRIKEIT